MYLFYLFANFELKVSESNALIGHIIRGTFIRPDATWVWRISQYVMTHPAVTMPAPNGRLFTEIESWMLLRPTSGNGLVLAFLQFGMESPK